MPGLPPREKGGPLLATPSEAVPDAQTCATVDLTWAGDRATLECDPSRRPGAKTEVAGGWFTLPPNLPLLRD